MGHLKWLVLLCYCLACVSINISSVGFATIAKSAAKWYGVSFNAINQLAFIGTLSGFLTMLPAIRLVETNYFEIPFYTVLIVSLAGVSLQALYPGPSLTDFYIMFCTKLVLALAAPLLSCLAPVLSKRYFPVEQRSLATSLGTISQVLGSGAGLFIAPFYKDDIPDLFVLNIILIFVPTVLSICCLDLAVCFTKVEVGTDTTYRRIVRRISSSFSRSPTESPIEQSRNVIHPHTTVPFLHSSMALPLLLEDTTVEPMDANQTQASGELELGLEAEHREQKVSGMSEYKVLTQVLSDFGFLRLLTACSLMSGVVNAWLALVNEAAPPSIDNSIGAQMICGLFFVLGTIGSFACGAVLDSTRAYAKIGRTCVLLGGAGSTVAMLGWHLDRPTWIFGGIAATGFFGMPIYPLTIEYGIELVYIRNGPNVGSTVSGLINLSLSIVGIMIIVCTTPGNISSLKKENIPLIWLFLNLAGGVVFFTVPARYRRLEAEQEVTSTETE